MNQQMGLYTLIHLLLLLLLLLLLQCFNVEAQPPSSQDNFSMQGEMNGMQPSLAVVIGILSIMFSLTFILLLYAKFCHSGSSVHTNQQIQDALVRSRSPDSGIDKKVIESLPFFRFSALKGSREGLECAVCLSKFEEIEILRLLPKCRHAFHIDCVDTWLEKHSSCPLCRHKVSTDDLSLLTYSNSLRFLWNQSEVEGERNLELFVEREENCQGSSRFSIGSSFRKFLKIKEEAEEELPIQENPDSDENEKVLHKFNHKIIVSDVVLKNRWSSVSSSDLMFLNSEMLNARSSQRFTCQDLSSDVESAATMTIKDGHSMTIKEEMDRKIQFQSKFSRIRQNDSISDAPFESNPISNESMIFNPAEKRSMSEIIVHPRFADFNTNNINREPSFSDEKSAKRERTRQIWLTIAQRTVQWFANRERRFPQTQNRKQSFKV